MYSKIVILQTAFLGDLFLAIPLLKELKSRFPQAQLALVCRKGLGQFFIQTELVQKLIEVDKADSNSYQDALQQTKAWKPDLVVSPHRSFRSGLFAWRTQAPVRVGFRDWWTYMFYNRHVTRPTSDHDVKRQLALLEKLEMGPSGPSQVEPSLLTSIKSNAAFEKYRGAIALAPGSQWATKRWTTEGYRKVASHFISKGHKVLVVGSAAEKELGDMMKSKVNEVENLCGTTDILGLAQLLSVCRLLITNDNGAMHVGSAAGTPVVAIFGPTVPGQGYAPWNPKSKIAQAKVGCRPCGPHGHAKCPIGTHECMNKVYPETVIFSAEELLS
ncbi:MAG: glycosyltransferase family 9 protein [Oligoflexia bacterium]|nr:glycosyltransferase family 9 protein [Oligoflexia bacterium]